MSNRRLLAMFVAKVRVQEGETVGDGNGKRNNVVGMESCSLEVFVERAVFVVLENDEMERGGGLGVVGGIETVYVLMSHVWELMNSALIEPDSLSLFTEHLYQHLISSPPPCVGFTKSSLLQVLLQTGVLDNVSLLERGEWVDCICTQLG